MEDKNQVIETLTKDLVTLAIKGHDLILRSEIRGDLIGEAHEFMEMCSTVYSRFVISDDRRNIGSDSTVSSGDNVLENNEEKE